jgi:hypothetical protein
LGRINTQILQVFGNRFGTTLTQGNVVLWCTALISMAFYQYLDVVVLTQEVGMGYGEEKPADASRSEDAFSKNRRAVLVY